MDVAFGATNNVIFTSWSGGTVLVSELREGGEVVTLRSLTAHSPYVYSRGQYIDWCSPKLAVSPNGKYIAVAFDIQRQRESTVWLWNACTGERYGLLGLRVLGGHVLSRNCFQSIVWSPDGEYIVSLNSDNRVYVWDFDVKVRCLYGCVYACDLYLSHTCQSIDLCVCICMYIYTYNM